MILNFIKRPLIFHSINKDSVKLMMIKIYLKKNLAFMNQIKMMKVMMIIIIMKLYMKMIKNRRLLFILEEVAYQVKKNLQYKNKR